MKGILLFQQLESIAQAVFYSDGRTELGRLRIMKSTCEVGPTRPSVI